MAGNYSQLKSDIAAYVKQNGDNDITGNGLQGQLLAMVNSLGAGYQYMGVAVLTPTPTDPGTPDQNVFYIATEPGMYANFGLTVADGEVAIFKYNGTWSKDVTGAVTAAQVTELGQMSNNKKVIAIKHINHGNFVGDSFDQSKYCINSGVLNIGKTPNKKLTIHHDPSHTLIVWKGSGTPSAGNQYTMFDPLGDQTGFIPDGTSVIVDEENIVVVFCRNPLSGTDVLTQADLDSANAYIEIADLYTDSPMRDDYRPVKGGGIYDADLKLEQLANDKGKISIQHIVYGNFVGDSFDQNKYCINSGVLSVGEYPRKIKVHHSQDYTIIIWVGSGAPSVSNQYTMLDPLDDQTGFIPDGTELMVYYPNMVVLVCKNPLSAADIISQSDLDSANAYVELLPVHNIENNVRTINKFSSLTEKSLYSAHINSLILAERLFTDGSGKSYGAGGVYTACYLSDLLFPLKATPEFFSLADINNICEKFIINRSYSTNMFPMSIALNGTVAAMYSGADNFHYRPCGDATFFMPEVLYDIYLNYGDISIFQKYYQNIEDALAAVPVNSESHLVRIEAGHEWVPWGFEEISRFLGDVCLASAFLYNAYNKLAKLFGVLGNTEKYTIYESKAADIKASMQEDSPLWSSSDGMYHAATLQNNQIDVFGSALCVYLDIATTNQKNAISDYLKDNFDSLTYGLGYCRQSNISWQICGDIPSDGSQNYIYINFYRDGNYQNGLWTVANYWVLSALAYKNEAKAVEYANDVLNVQNTTTEWFAIPPAQATPTPSDNKNQIMATAGTLRWVRENSFLL